MKNVTTIHLMFLILFSGGALSAQISDNPANNSGKIAAFEMQPVYGMPSSEMTLNVDRKQGPFYLVNVELFTVLEIMEKLLGKPIICSSSLPQNLKFSLKIENKVPTDEAIKIFKSLLMLNGIALIPIDDEWSYKAVPSAGVSSQIPEFLFDKASSLSPSQNIYTKFFELKHINVSDIEGKLKSSLSPNNVGVFEIFPKSNLLLVTDTVLNLQRIEILLDKLDVSLNETAFFTMRNSSASDIKDKISSLNLDSLKNTIIEADVRTNKLIVVGGADAVGVVRNFVEELDVKSDAALKSDVIYIKHGDAVKMVEVLTKIASSQKEHKSRASGKKDQHSDNSQSNEKIASNEKPPSDILGSGDAKKDDVFDFSESVRLVADERSNSIVVCGTDSDLAQIKSIIEKLDIVLMQVKIDVLITEVALSEDQVSGLSSFGLGYNVDSVSGFSGSTKTYSLSNAGNPAFSVSATEKSFSMLFDVAREKQNIKVLSSPTIVTTHNKEAEVNISQSLPVITSSMSDISSISTTRSSVSYKDIGIRLVVTPLVGKNGNIQLKIDQSVDSISGYTTIDNNQQPIVSKRKATSFVSAKSDEVITLAGLQQVDTSEINGGVWLLSDIPLLGELFKPSKNAYERKELIIFIRPTIIESSEVEDIIKSKDIENSPVKDQIKEFYGKGRFYSDGELEKRSEDFESNRVYNRLNPMHKSR